MLLLLIAGGATNFVLAQSAVTVGSQVTSESQIISGKAYVLFYVSSDEANKSGYVKAKDSFFQSNYNDQSPTEESLFFFISNGDSENPAYKIKSYYKGTFFPVPTKSTTFTPTTEASAGTWELNFQGNNNVAPSCSGFSLNRSSVSGVSNTYAIHGWDSGTGAANQFKIYEVSSLTPPVDVTSGWYQIKWVALGSQSSTGYSDDVDVAGKYVRNYAQDITVNEKKYPLYLASAPTTIDENASSLVYVDFGETVSQNGTDLSGVRGALRSSNGHYISIDGTASSEPANNYIVYYSKGSYPNNSIITSGVSGNTRTSLVPRISDTTPYIGQTDAGKFPMVQFNRVNPAYLGLQAWTVTIDEGENAQVTYTGSAASGLTSVYDGGSFFLTAGVTPSASEFTAPTYNGINPFIAVDATNHKIVVSYVAVSKVYTLKNAAGNYISYEPTQSTTYIWSSGKTGATAFNATSANYQWVFIPSGASGEYYLYNVGAEMFAIPTAKAQSTNNSWVFSKNAVAVTLVLQDDKTFRIKMARDPVYESNAAYMHVNNNYLGPVFNYNDGNSNFTFQRVNGDQSSGANAAVAKLVKSQTALTAAPTSSGWYALQIKTAGNDNRVGRFVKVAKTEVTYSGTQYPLTFMGDVDVQPAITDPTFFTYIDVTNGYNNATWQLPNGKYLVLNSSNKFPTSSTDAATIIAGYDGGSYFKSGDYYAVSDLSYSNYFIWGTTGYKLFTAYPINLTTAGLTPWKVVLEGLDASTLVTCTRSDVSGLTSVYNNGYFFLPTVVTPAQGNFTTTIDAATVTLNAVVDTEAKTITLSIPTLTITSLLAEASFTWNGVTKTGKTVTFVYDGGTISDNNITVSYTGNEYTSPTLSQTTWDGTGNANVTCTLTPAFFSANYGDKWVRLVSAKAPTLVVDLASTSAGGSATMQGYDYLDPAQLWCLVGNASSFTLYNKAAGENFVLTSGAAAPGQNTTITLQAKAGASNSTWTLGNGQLTSNDAPGYALYATGGDGSYSLHGWQSGNTVKYWGASSGGSHFLIEDASGEVSLAFDGLDPSTMTVYTQNIANLTSTIGGTTSQSLLTKDNFVTRTAYVPNGAELTFGTPALFQNYGFTGYDGTTDQTKTVTATPTPQTVTATFSVVRPDARYLWEASRVSSNDCYRIPAIVTAQNGDILAICDRRFDNDSDLGSNHHIDIIGVASSDNGQTWGSEFMVMDGNNGGEVGYGDAAVVADRESNKVLVMACGGNVSYQAGTTDNHQVVVRTELTHNGTSWVASDITDKTSQFYYGDLASCPALFIGSGSITQSNIIKKGDYYRIYCAILARSSKNYVLYSDDFGVTWTYLGSQAASGDEAKVAELPDGSVLLSVRKGYTGRIFNVWSWSDDTYTTGSWGVAVNTNEQTNGLSNHDSGNGTNGDIRMIPAINTSTGENVVLAMQSSPNGNSRSKVSIFYKALNPAGTYTSPVTVAENWSDAFEVTPHNSAYSVFNPQPDGRIAFFMEESPISTTGFYMCYMPLTINEITNGAYTSASTYPVTLNTVGDKSYATLYLPFDVTTDVNTKAYVIGEVSDGKARMTELTGGEIAARTAVVLVNETSNSATFNVTSGLTPQVTEAENYLKGTLTSMSLDLSGSTNYYSMGVYDDKIGFYKFDDGKGTTSITLGANKAYLDTTAPGGAVKGFVLDFGGEDGISLTSDSSQTGEGSRIYDLSGRQVNTPSLGEGRSGLSRGVYIVGGKKAVIK